MPPRLLLQQLPPPAPPPPPLPADNHHGQQRRVLLAATVGSAAACLVLLILLFVVVLRRRYLRRRPTLPFSPPPAPARPLRRYSRRDLRRATAGFHPSRLLGRGAASPVYLATFPCPTSSLAAVKTRASPQELHLLASLPADSPRVVSLLGYCSSGGGLSLVLEYMPQGSLQTALFGGGDEARFLDWPKRVGVIRDVARALAFLHGECRPPVVHGDLKPSNVLLDADFRAKLADFGLARFKNSQATGGDEFMSQELASAAWGKEEQSTAGPAAGIAWWKQDGSGELDARDYVADWIGSQICPDDDNATSTNLHKNSPSTVSAASPEAAGNQKEATKMREWWKEEFFEEMSKKAGAGDASFDKLSSFRRSRKRSRRRRSRSVGSDANNNGDLLSRELSSTTSMRGTVCYVAPECGGGDYNHDGDPHLEKADVYSFGVLLLVILSGRRPLHILSSPMKLERANLVSWCRHLARAGNVLDLIDDRLPEYDRDQASMCVHLALLCLQRQPDQRPDAADIVKILHGEMDLPPADFSPSPRVRAPFPRSSRRATPQQPDNAADP